MADLSSLLGAGSGSQSQSDLLVDAYRRTEQTRIDTLNQKKFQLESRKTFFNTLNSKLNSLVSNLDKFTAENAASKFTTRKVTVSDTSVLTATADSEANLSANKIFVENLATNDIIISDRLGMSGLFGESAGTQSFDITVNGETKTIDVTFEGTETNNEAMQLIADAINDTEDISITASVIRDTSSTARITFSSNDSGTENSITFTDSSVLAKLGFTTNLFADPSQRVTSEGTAAGYRTSDSAGLDAKLNINGIDVFRASNTIDDLLTGVTFNLLKAQEADEAPVTMKSEVDGKAVEELIKPLLDSFNGVMTFLKDNRSIQRQDTSVVSMYSSIRGLASEEITGLGDDVPKRLTDIGIKIGTNGELSISDSARLLEILKDDPQQIADIFTSENSFVNKISNTIEMFVGDSGLIKSRTKSLSEQIDTTVERTKELQSRIDTRAEALRNEYEDLLRVYYEAQSQYSMLGSYSGGTSAGSYY